MFRHIATVFLFTAVMVLSSEAMAGDREDIMAVVEKYRTTEVSGDLTAQAELMTEDRLWVSALRMQGAANQQYNMARQQFDKGRRSTKNPDFKLMITYIDPIVRVYGEAAVASFLQRRSGRDPDFELTFYTTLVLVKNDGIWKIDVTHQSPLRIPQ